VSVGWNGHSNRQEAGVIKRLTQWQHLPGADPEEAVAYWRSDHARLVAEVPLVKGYVQNICLVGPDESQAPYAGLGEVWFDSFEDADRVAASAEWAAVIADARTFMDFQTLVVAWAEENVGVPPPRSDG
jgi:uncharacterized protein (TIGR02118 family)